MFDQCGRAVIADYVSAVQFYVFSISSLMAVSVLGTNWCVVQSATTRCLMLPLMCPIAMPN
jgi:hypothetical protein